MMIKPRLGSGLRSSSVYFEPFSTTMVDVVFLLTKKPPRWRLDHSAYAWQTWLDMFQEGWSPILLSLPHPLQSCSPQ